MNKAEFIDRTLNRLFETFMPPGMEKVKRRLKERQELPDGIERAAWELYEYSDDDRRLVEHKLRAAAREVVLEATKGVGRIEVGLVASEGEDGELERTFRGNDEQRVLHQVQNYAEDQGYSIEEPPQGSESMWDWRFDGRRLQQLDG